MDLIKKKMAIKRVNDRQNKIKKALKSEKVIRTTVRGAIAQQQKLAGVK